MKRVAGLILLFIVVFVFAACNRWSGLSPVPVESIKFIGNHKLIERFDKVMTVKDVLDDISEINLSMKMDSISGLDKRTETEGNRSIDYYSRNDTLLYAVYNGYENDRWDYFTDSKSGLPLDVAFWDENDVRNVNIVSDKYEASYGEKTLITIKNGEEYATYEIYKNNCFITNAHYIDEDGIPHNYEYDIDYNTMEVLYEMDSEQESEVFALYSEENEA